MVTKIYKVFGYNGHRQRQSFAPSVRYDWSAGSNTRIIEILNSDTTGTNDYSIVKITRNTAQECELEMLGQLDDGIFENSRYGRVEEVNE